LGKENKNNVTHTGPSGMAVVYDQEDAENLYDTNEDILDDIRPRLKGGAKKYGENISINDKRDFAQELYEELLDAVVYATVLGKTLVTMINKKKNGER
jgi:hypothetical protein